MKFLSALPLLLMTACATASMRDAEMTKSFTGSSAKRPAGYRNPKALDNFVNRLLADGRNWRQHGIYVETLEGAEPVAMLNEGAEFNPASVIKLATTLAALDKLGVNYRFRTEFRADGAINSQTGDLNGDLILLSGGDPSFSISDAQKVGAELQRMGVRRINGALVVVGEFTCNENSSTHVSAEVFRRQSKLAFARPTYYESFLRYRPRGRSLLTVESDSLLSIVQYLNAHSVNAMAEMLASHLGGPQGVQKFLVDQVGMPQDSVYISYASGLEVNRMTPRETVKLLRALMGWLSRYKLQPSSVMTTAGIDSGTLRGRFTEGKFAGSLIGKTGTLYSTDAGVAALAGVMNTRDRGPLLFAVYDMAEGKRVSQLRRLQDGFLKQLMMECGGPAPMVSRGSASYARPHSRFIPAP